MPKTRRVAIMLDLDWPYKRHAGIFAGTQQYGQEHGWESIVDEFADHTLPANPGPRIPYDGVIGRATAKLALRAARLKLPVVNVWFSSPAWNKLPGVFPDYSAIGRMRAEHLLARGFHRFAVLTSKQDRGHVVEMKAFSDAVNKAGCSCVVANVPLHSSATVQQARTAERVIAAWMKACNPPIGVFVGAETYGRVVAQMCRYHGWRVPQDVAIITGANEEAICEHLRPTLTSVEFGFERIGYEAARLLDQLMDGGSPPAEPILLPAQNLVVRESTDFFAVDDELIAKALAYIAAKSHLEIGPDDVAEAVRTHPRTLQRHFRKLLGRPIATEIRRVRIERAKRELSQSNNPLAQIARDVGFGKAMRMYEVFQRELGIAPSEYRRKRRCER